MGTGVALNRVSHEIRSLGRCPKGPDRHPSGLGLGGESPGFASDRDQQIRPGVEAGHHLAHFLVADGAERSQLQHITQHDEQPFARSPNLSGGQQGLPHGGRVGVIRVVKNRQLTLGRGKNRHSARSAVSRLQGVADRLQTNATLGGHGNRHQGGEGKVTAQQTQADRARPDRRPQHKARSPTRDPDVGRPKGVGVLFAEGDNPAPGLARDGLQQGGVIAVDDRQPIGGQGGDQLGLGRNHPGQIGQHLGVLFGNRGDDPDVRAGQPAEQAQLTGTAGAHLQDQDVFRAVGAQQGQRQADLVVQIAQGGQAWFVGGAHLGQQFFCRRLAVAAGDTDDPGGQAGAVPGRQILEGGQRIGHADAHRSCR